MLKRKSGRASEKEAEQAKAVDAKKPKRQENQCKDENKQKRKAEEAEFRRRAEEAARQKQKNRHVKRQKMPNVMPILKMTISAMMMRMIIPITT